MTDTKVRSAQTPWRHQQEGLGLFLSPGFRREAPFPVAERPEVGDPFVLRPLLPLLGQGSFYVLALSRNEVRLLEVRGGRVRRMDLGDTPRSLEEGPGSRLTAQGRGTGEEDAKAELRRYLQRVDAGLAGRLEEDLPLVLAGVESLLPIYREVSRHPRLADEGIAGNPERLADEDLARRARPLAEPLYGESRRRAEARYAELAGSRRASTSPAEILAAAGDGRVEALFVSTTADLRGRWADGRIQPGGDDLLDLAAAWTLEHGGRVYAVADGEGPDGAEVAATFRY